MPIDNATRSASLVEESPRTDVRLKRAAPRLPLRGRPLFVALGELRHLVFRAGCLEMALR